jgi:hypothetical protein
MPRAIPLEEKHMKIPSSFETELRKLEELKILRKINPELLPKQLVDNSGFPEVKVLVVSCCDGHQFLDITRHVGGVLGERGKGICCVHWRTENGGPFVLSVPSLSLRQYRGTSDRVDINLLAAMEESIHLKEIEVIILLAHAVCGKVKEQFTSLVQYCRALSDAKGRVMAEFNFPKEQVLTWIQLQYPDENRRTYHLSTSAMNQFTIADSL